MARAARNADISRMSKSESLNRYIRRRTVQMKTRCSRNFNATDNFRLDQDRTSCRADTINRDRGTGCIETVPHNDYITGHSSIEARLQFGDGANEVRRGKRRRTGNNDQSCDAHTSCESSEPMREEWFH